MADDIKPLEWEYHPAGAMAAPATGFAYIIDTRRKGRVYSLKGFNPQREFTSLDEAKAAAQADYEERVRSVLVDQSEVLDRVKREARNEALREALEIAWSWHDNGNKPGDFAMMKVEAAILALMEDMDDE